MIDDRTLVHIQVSENLFSIRTISPRFKSSSRFVFLKSEFSILQEKRFLLSCDCGSYAELRLTTAPGGEEVMQILFRWLHENGDHTLSGYANTIWLPYERFRQMAEGNDGMNGQSWSMLSLSDVAKRRPRLLFQSRRYLHEVIKRPNLRHKLGVFLDRHLQWPNTEKIVISDDFLPYSFFFTEYTPNGVGICGGIILHGQEDLSKSYYGIHT